jgi:hypothetical protein
LVLQGGAKRGIQKAGGAQEEDQRQEESLSPLEIRPRNLVSRSAQK